MPPGCRGTKVDAVRVAGAAFLVPVLLIVVSACASVPSAGPMDLGGPEEWSTCVSSEGEVVAVGDVFSITGPNSATLKSLRLVDADGVELEESYVLPVVDGYVGADAYPPEIAGWDERVALAGAPVAPGAKMSVLLAIKPIGEGAHTTQGFVVQYEVDGTTHENRNFTAYEIREDCAE